MKIIYILTVIACLGTRAMVFSQAPEKTNLQNASADTARRTPFNGRQLNIVLPLNGGISVDATTTVEPYFGYNISGIPRGYTMFNGNTNQFEYHQSSDVTPDFLVSGNTKAVFNTSFLGVGASAPTNGFTGFSLKNSTSSWYGMYIDAGTTGSPFYGYALNGNPVAYTQFNGNTNQFEYFHSNASVPDFQIGATTASFPAVNFLGIGTTNPTTGFTGLALKKNTNSWYGMYIDAGATGSPFYGYALNGNAVAYTQFNGIANQFEYYHSNPSVPDFQVGATSAAFPAINFLGIGTTSPTTGYTGLAVKNNTNGFWGMYIDAGPSGFPFYGYALNGSARAYTQFNSATSQFEYHQSSDATPDFFINGSTKAVFNTGFVGIGTSNATSLFSGLEVYKNQNDFWGMYVGAGPTGKPFYGYALGGVAIAWTQLNGTSNNWELDYNGPRVSVTSAGNVGIGVSLPAQRLDVNGTIHASSLNGGATSLSTDASGNIIRTPSDARLKCEVASIDRPLEKVLQLHGVSYKFIDSKRFGDERQMGFLAQDLEKIVPETVSSGGEYKSVNYQELTALLTEAMKEQQKIIEQLKERVEILEKEKK